MIPYMKGMGGKTGTMRSTGNTIFPFFCHKHITILEDMMFAKGKEAQEKLGSLKNNVTFLSSTCQA